MTASPGLRTTEVPLCLLCGKTGQRMYDALGDRLFSVAGRWGLLRCGDCGLLWLSPRPLPSERGGLYSEYYTHGELSAQPRIRRLRREIRWAVLSAGFGYANLRLGTPVSRLGGHLLKVLPAVKKKVQREVLYLDGRHRGRLLDVGCGDGSFLLSMRDLGWDVYGVEPDPKAAQVARNKCRCEVEDVELHHARFPDGFFDAITLNHVIEHVPDPVSVLTRCRRLLRKDGILVVATPNGNSLGHRLLKAAWRELDPPRHFFVFNGETLRRCLSLAAFKIEREVSSSRNASRIWLTSSQIRRHGHMQVRGRGYGGRLAGAVFAVSERVLQSFCRSAISEEIAMVARKG